MRWGKAWDAKLETLQKVYITELQKTPLIS